MNLGLLWAQFGPYHIARAESLQSLANPHLVCAIELASASRDYRWQRQEGRIQVTTLYPQAQAEQLKFPGVLRACRRALGQLKVDACLLPSYSPASSLAALLAARSLGVRTVMMNESHAGTARARGLSASLKRRLVGLFDTALVGGAPHKRYFASLGLPEDRIFTGYDAVDNDYFARQAGDARSHQSQLRAQYGLPEHYFLSLGRFVPKKNLATLIHAYKQFLDVSSAKKTHLVMVGSGEEESKLRALCAELRLPICAHQEQTPLCTPHSALRTPGVHFFGFRQIAENPIFYGLAEAFILPSLYEEWGLVVNEAMASGLPVIVSETAGCAEDLLEPGAPCETDSHNAVQLASEAGLSGKLRQNGFVFAPQSSDELARSLTLLESNPAVCAAMGQNSRRIIEKFSCENFARNALLAAEMAVRRNQSLP
jgi:glycosyltransferase involved in cell wall biosynthesis